MRRIHGEKKKKPFSFLALSVLSLAVLFFVFFFIPPSSAVDIYGIQIGMLFFVFPLLFIFTFSMLSFLFRRKTHGLLAGSFVIIYLILRLGGFTHPLFLLLLLALLLILELLFTGNKKGDESEIRKIRSH